MSKLFLPAVLAAVLCLVANPDVEAARPAKAAVEAGSGYEKRSDVREFIAELVRDEHFSRATLVRWFGVAEANIPTITPSIGNFTTQDLGFLT